MNMSKDKAIGAASVRLSKKITRIINFYLKPYNITTEQWGVLRTLSESDHISQKQLSKRADKDQATLTKILDLLEKNEFIQRVQNPSDRRSFIIKITDKGSQLCEELIPFLEKAFEKLLMDIDGEYLLIYQQVVELLERNIDSLLDDANN
ncbi:MarR family winged helix-turn-helix transcriptional regulator [Bacillus sp. Marseille-P3661]|uniref:MarR family winged helix-turn-helix transcriptional regulator n=1 Tax=Bacillus sp. Marseille-P3661 TaxID=1936234 RepID=UPI0021554651|nr:MarR family transcriptional regulator [Bacillus sp. Marseille-P3661]